MNPPWKHLSTIWKLSLLILLFVIGCERSETQTESINMENLPTKQADSVVVITTLLDKIEQKMFADHFDEYDDGMVITENVFLENYHPDGTIKYTLKCDRAEVDDIKKIITAIGNVVITSEQGILKTSFLLFNQQTEKIDAPNDVVLIREDNILYGSDLKTDINFEKIEIKSVSAEGKIDDETFNW
jgi:LPS export ABC transporter protein LptC